MIGASIYILELGTGAVSNVYGFYSITIPKGIYEITYSYVGYEPVILSPNLTSSTTKDIRLPAKPPLLEEIVVSGRSSQTAEEIQLGKIHLPPQTVTEIPALFGEMDVVKTLESVPGVKLQSDGSTFYYVRGGNKDQNLILIDDAPIYNPSHMLGVFSTIIPDAVTDIALYKGNMPASLGGRLSSILDIRTKQGNDTKFEVWGNLGLISTKLGVEGPIKKERSYFLLSGRFSRIKWFFKQQDDNLERLDFYDLTGKLNFKLNQNNKIFFSFYNGSDNFFDTNSGISWSNNAATFRWNHLSSKRLFLNTTLYASAYDYALHTDLANNTKWSTRIANFSLKTDFSYFIKPHNILSFGLGLGGHNFNPGI